MYNKIFALFSLCFVLGGSSALADEVSMSLHGCYTVTRGHVESVAISQTQQMGMYRIILKHNNWRSLSDKEQSHTIKRFVADGPILGNITGIDNTGKVYLTHIMSDKESRGLLISQDSVYTPTTIPEPCNNSSSYILTGIETVSINAGTGIFAGLDPQQTASIQVEGTVNSCSGQNDFEVIDGELCFQ